MNSGHTLFFRASASCSKLLSVKTYIQYSENCQAKLCFSGQAQSCSKLLNGKIYIKYSEKFQSKLCFSGKRKLVKIANGGKNFITVFSMYIHLQVIRVLWASVCVIWTKVVIGYDDFDLDQALVFCKNRTIG